MGEMTSRKLKVQQRSASAGQAEQTGQAGQAAQDKQKIAELSEENLALRTEIEELRAALQDEKQKNQDLRKAHHDVNERIDKTIDSLKSVMAG